MALEVANFINQLIDTNPTGSDPASSSDDHHRLVKRVLLQTFPNLDAAVTATPAMLNGAKVALGAGPGQQENAVSIGWGGVSNQRLLASVDGVDLGEIVLEENLRQAAPPGMFGLFFRPSPPAGWLKANGAAISRTTYARLWSAIGNTFGAGDGSTTFNLPDMRGLFARGWDDGRGMDAGRVFSTYQEAQNLWHAHGGSTTVAGNHGHSGVSEAGGNHGHSGVTNTAGNHAHTMQQTRNSGGSGGAASLKSEDPAAHTMQQTRNSGGSGGAASLKSEDPAGSAISTSTAGAHAHGLVIDAGGVHAHGLNVYAAGDHAHGIPGDGGAEVRVRNMALLACIKF